MKTFILIRIAAVITLLYSGGHMSGYPWTPGETTGALGAVRAMQSNHFDTLSFTRTYWDFYIGFGDIIGLFLLGLSILIWLVANIARYNSNAVKPMLIVVALMFLANATLSWWYFFAIPAVMALVITILLVVSLGMQRKI